MVKSIDLRTSLSSSLYLNLTLLNLISPFFISKLFGFYVSIIWFFISIIGKILLAAANPWFIPMFNVANDLTG